MVQHKIYVVIPDSGVKHYVKQTGFKRVVSVFI